MGAPYNRAQMRDLIRDKMGVTPPSYFDPSAQEYGIVGAQPTWNPAPSNGSLNAALDEATREINRRAGLRANLNLAAAFPAQTGNGPLLIDLKALTSGETTLQGQIDTIRRVMWDDGNGTLTRLYPTSREDADRNSLLFQNTPAALPQQYWIEGYQLAIYPAMAAAGTLRIIAGTAFLAFQTDADTLEQVPADYQMVWVDWCVTELSRRDTQNAEALARAQMYAPKAEAGILELIKWQSGGVNEAQQASFGFASYRRSTQNSQSIRR